MVKSGASLFTTLHPFIFGLRTKIKWKIDLLSLWRKSRRFRRWRRFSGWRVGEERWRVETALHPCKFLSYRYLCHFSEEWRVFLKVACIRPKNFVSLHRLSKEKSSVSKRRSSIKTRRRLKWWQTPVINEAPERTRTVILSSRIRKYKNNLEVSGINRKFAPNLNRFITS